MVSALGDSAREVANRLVCKKFLSPHEDKHEFSCPASGFYSALATARSRIDTWQDAQSGKHGASTPG